MYLWVWQISDPSPLLELLDNHLLVRCLSSGEAERDLGERVEGIQADTQCDGGMVAFLALFTERGEQEGDQEFSGSDKVI